ncbi:MAG: GyrI-like domain-containing protein [Chloroflexi bacterium]|nr:GyrI-like domain-containing protein [Chloroflexota bacterium]
MKKVDLRKQYKHLYAPSAKAVGVVDVPPLNFLMIDGQGNPNTSPDFGAALEALYAMSYTLKFAVKLGKPAIDYPVMALEGLWWTDDMSRFSVDVKDLWKWTAMMMQPEFVTQAMVDEARAQVARKKNPAALPKVRFEVFHEGPCAQIMHIGPYATEGPTIKRLHVFIEEGGHTLRGKHHEIYLSDPRRAAPEKLKTVIRQPFA